MDSWSRDRGSERGWEKESERRGEIEQRGSSRVIGLRHAANAASSSLYSLFKHYFCSPPPPCLLTRRTPFLTTHLPPYAPPLHCLLYHTHSKHFLSSFTFSSFLCLPSHTSYSCLCIQHLLVCVLTPPGNEHQGCAPKGWRARELPQGLLLSFDLFVLPGCLVAGRRGVKELNVVSAKVSLTKIIIIISGIHKYFFILLVFKLNFLIFFKILK